MLTQGLKPNPWCNSFDTTEIVPRYPQAPKLALPATAFPITRDHPITRLLTVASRFAESHSLFKPAPPAPTP